MTNTINSLYSYIWKNAETMSSSSLDRMLKELETLCLSRHIKRKCKDNRPIDKIKHILKTEYGSES